MNIRVTFLSLATLALFCGNGTAQSSAPKLLPFQGRLTDQNGVAVSNGVRLVQFKIYGVPTGGSPVWAGELHRTTVNGGLVNVLLGSKTPFAGVDFDQQLYLEITVDINGDNSITLADPPMLPRQGILPVVFAEEAADSRKLAGYDWTPVFGTNNPTIPLPASKLADGSLPGAKIQPASITSNQIATASILPSQIVPASLTSTQMATNSVTLSRLAKEVLDQLVPPGSVQAYAGSVTPDGWLPCDGSPVVSTNYPRLFAAIGTTWGAGYTNGVQLGDFNLPDLCGMFLRGVSGTSTNDPGRAERLHEQRGELVEMDVARHGATAEADRLRGGVVVDAAGRVRRQVVAVADGTVDHLGHGALGSNAGALTTASPIGSAVRLYMSANCLLQTTSRCALSNMVNP